MPSSVARSAADTACLVTNTATAPLPCSRHDQRLRGVPRRTRQIDQRIRDTRDDLVLAEPALDEADEPHQALVARPQQILLVLGARGERLPVEVLGPVDVAVEPSLELRRDGAELGFEQDGAHLVENAHDTLDPRGQPDYAPVQWIAGVGRAGDEVVADERDARVA